ncbi:large subunit ribosomal protein L29 [Balneicella halophila]|uniref:Large ribosomal subunit protein uL29 n=1 Tax=Balneicella halophila TaxID=1537566 RepID=A0A7L4URW6_BALHA|nr:50S ribosomal protein L29 [Balneicella halophila]PVX52399.1 large subunit ribosomal protein L29 [Balneicella halophila]
MKNSEIRELSTADLQDRLLNEQEQLSNLKFDHAVSPLENPTLIKATRRNVARIKTELNARKLAEK